MGRNFWVPVFCGGIILTIGMGARQSFGIFLKPISMDLNLGREVWSLSIALAALLTGIVSPFVGTLADRFGAARTVAAGGLIYTAGMAMNAAATGAALLIAGNLLTGVGAAAAGLAPILGVVGRSTPMSKRVLAFGVVTAGGSFGQFAVVPFASVLQNHYGNWHVTMWALTAASVLMVLLAVGLREPRITAAAAVQRQGAGAALREAFNTPGYLLLVLGFFVCGFHVAFVGTHLPAYISDRGVGLDLFGVAITPGELGGWAIGLVGLFNICGALLWGMLGGKYRRKNMLTLLYLLRSLAFVLFLLLPLSGASVLAFAASLGFLWLGTVPLTSGIVSLMFGPVHMSMLFGIAFFSHQIGSFLGGWGGGRLFDATGSYGVMWTASIALGIMAALCNWPIRERPVPRLAAAAAQ